MDSICLSYFYFGNRNRQVHNSEIYAHSCISMRHRSRSYLPITKLADTLRLFLVKTNNLGDLHYSQNHCSIRFKYALVAMERWSISLQQPSSSNLQMGGFSNPMGPIRTSKLWQIAIVLLSLELLLCLSLNRGTIVGVAPVTQSLALLLLQIIRSHPN